MPLNDILETITGQPSPSTTSFPSIPTLRPDNNLRKSGGIPSRHQMTPANSSRPISDPRKSTGVERRPISNEKKPSTTASASTPSRNGRLSIVPATAPAPSKPPKKGSFAEIMARGKAAQDKIGQVGKIQHKKIEKSVLKKERVIEKEKRATNIRSGLDSKSKFQQPQRPGQPLSRDGKHVKPINKKTPKEPEKRIKKAALATTGYAGTARPKSAVTPGVRPAASSSSRYERGRGDRGVLGSRYDRYESEDEEDEDIEEEEDYRSDASSDMEAAAFEVDAEEEAATRIAKREDAAALEEENRLKREKDEKRKKLEALRKKAAPPRY
ncbi:hypothetical protein BJ878DRAFT_574438 [Calycina marina]|uniref:SPT2 chromatin protein n=1 Tax=Calycina marina TaxID=1763456 RepID=A0A9P8CG85_9HELO|nr:hypothetical protein BJ878DRAFT_574438 [Calycina marina]